jgi:hypothetical protein
VEGQRRLGSQEANKGLLYVHKSVFTWITYLKKVKTVTDSKIAGNWDPIEDI